MSTRFLSGLVIWLSLVASFLVPLESCTSPNHPSDPSVDPVLPLAMTCPADRRVQDVKTSSQAVTYSTPGFTGGVEPVTVICSTPSGGQFPLGSTSVTCNATDSATPARSAACSFTVTLSPVVVSTQNLSATSFMAYGDSITAGEINDDDNGSRCEEPGAFFRPNARFPSLAYPALVQQMLTNRYAQQTFTMKNEGAGENKTSDTKRFALAVRVNRPEAVLFLQGVVDLNDETPVPSIVANIRTDIVEARQQGVGTFFLSTLTPVLNFSRGCFTTNADVRALNDAIRSLAASENVPLVDTWATFVGYEEAYMRGDGLHPTVAGQEAIARAFFDVIVSKLEPLPSAPPGTNSFGIAPAAGRD